MSSLSNPEVHSRSVLPPCKQRVRWTIALYHQRHTKKKKKKKKEKEAGTGVVGEAGGRGGGGREKRVLFVLGF